MHHLHIQMLLKFIQQTLMGVQAMRLDFHVIVDQKEHGQNQVYNIYQITYMLVVVYLSYKMLE